MGFSSLIRKTWKKLTVAAGGTLEVSGTLEVKPSATVIGLSPVVMTGTPGQVLTMGDDDEATFADLPPVDIPVATVEAKGIMKMSMPVDDAAGDAPTAEEFNALLDALREAEILAVEE